MEFWFEKQKPVDSIEFCRRILSYSMQTFNASMQVERRLWYFIKNIWLEGHTDYFYQKINE